MKLFSKAFNINANNLEFLDIDLEKDNQFFLDPYLISIDDSPFSKKCIKKINRYFESIIQYSASDSVPEMLELSQYIKEHNETFLGYSREKRIKGIGFCQKDVMNIFYQIQKKNLSAPLIEDTYDCLIFLDRVGNDKISDLITNIMLEDLIEFTQQQCQKHNIPMLPCTLKDPILNFATMSWITPTIMLPIYDGKPIILVPRHLVGEEQYFSVARVHRDFVIYDLKSNYAKLGFIKILKKGTSPDCKKIRQAYPLSKKVVANYSLQEHEKYLNFKAHLLNDNSINLVEAEKDRNKEEKNRKQK